MKPLNWIKNHFPTQRRLIQLYAALLYNANLKGYISGEIYTGNTKALCLPGLNCYSCPGAVGACPLGALQNALASSGSRAPYYILGILLLFGLTLGRTICGFLCPFGLLQELLYKIPTPKLKKNRVTRALSYLKYVILVIFVIVIPLWYLFRHLPMPAFCKYICPAGTLEGAVGLLANRANAETFFMLNILFTRKFVILAVTAAACVFVYRSFCRFLCPLGAIYGLFSRLRLVGVALDESRCIHCDRCVKQCKMDIRHVGDHECINCSDCAELCPTGAISFRAGRPVLRANDGGDPYMTANDESDARPAKKNPAKYRRAAAWCAALIVLAGALWYYNAAPSIPAEERSVGSEVGMRGPGFSVPLYGGGTFSLADARGKVTVLNFWATWCTPCCAELPYFDRLARTLGDDVTIIALHSELVTDDVEEYLANYDYTIPFALDNCGAIEAYGGSVMLPQTVILDQDGVIVYNQVGSVTYEKLESLVAPLIDS